MAFCSGEAVEGKEGVGGLEAVWPGLWISRSLDADSLCVLNKPLMLSEHPCVHRFDGRQWGW